MKSAYCTQCRKVTIMTKTLAAVPLINDAGKIEKTTIENYHCISCGSFIISEEKGEIKTRVNCEVRRGRW